ncbi:hypothetical protein GCM10009592_26610 [Brachybacterium rhamnosum]|uniref:LSM domain-containing protein n=1 Tax=Brachybacterium rhamnosum TaxID=173361 RepID=A0ABW4Q3A0_9MICO
MRLLKMHKGRQVRVHLDGVVLLGVLVDVARDSVSLATVEAATPEGTTKVPGTVIVASAQIVFAAVVS